jgi:hypothetical protein
MIHPPPANIHLEPHDWYFANWRNLPPLPKGSAAPFDLGSCRKRLLKLKLGASGKWNWNVAQIPQWMSAEEATFWLRALIFAETVNDSKALDARIADAPGLDRSSIVRGVGNAKRGRIPELISVLATLFPPVELVQVLLMIGKQVEMHDSLHDVVGPGFRRYVRPYLTDDDRAAMRPFLISEFRALGTSCWQTPRMVQEMLVSVGAGESTKEIADQLGSTAWVGWLRASEDRNALRQHLHARCLDADHVRGLIAHLEQEAVARLLDARWSGDRKQQEMVLGEVGRIHRPSIAPVMLAQLATKAKSVAQSWLAEHVELAVPGLLPLLLSHRVEASPHGSFQRAEVIEYLRGVIRAGKLPLMRSHLHLLDEATQGALLSELQSTIAQQDLSVTQPPEWFPALQKVRLPKWIDVSQFPTILVNDKPLAAECVPMVLDALRKSSLSEAQPLVVLLKEHAEPRSLEAFAIALVDRWHLASSKSEDNWALNGVVHFGQDRAALRLESLIALMGNSEQNVKCRAATDALAAIDCVQALASLQTLSRIRSGRAWVYYASQTFQRTLKDRNILADFADDFAISTLGLESPQCLDLGRRSFTLSLSPTLQPCLLDARHHRVSELPAIASEDNPVQYELAVAQWTDFRNRANHILNIQRRRLEREMRSEKRWPVDLFLSLISHPLMNHLYRAIVFGVFDIDSRTLLSSFRVIQSECVDIAGRPIAFPEGATIGIVHPTQMGQIERGIWGDCLAEHDLTPPFVQLARVPHTVPAEQSFLYYSEQLKGRLLDHGEQFSPNRSGWRSCAGGWLTLWKLFPVARQVAVIMIITADSRIDRCTFVACANPTNFIPAGPPLSLGEVDALVYDETMRVGEPAQPSTKI